MKKQITTSQLRTLVKEVLQLNENLKDKEPAGENSVDSQIDAYFSRYESEAKNSKNEGHDFRLLMRRFLTEADDDKDENKDKDKSKDKDELKDKKLEKLSIDDLDVDSFADSVVRLVDNYDSLLEMRNTILRRAINFLVKNYEKDVADAFKESMMERHGLEVGKSKSESDDENFQAPAADRAGASPGGA